MISEEKKHVAFGKYDVSDKIILMTDYTIAFPTNIPIVPGHVLLCPRRIVAKFEDLTSLEREELFDLMAQLKIALTKAFQAEGFNIAWNEGEIAGQTVPHVHVHIVPRKSGDEGVVDYEPRQFLYRPGSREISPAQELQKVSQYIAEHLPD